MSISRAIDNESKLGELLDLIATTTVSLWQTEEENIRFCIGNNVWENAECWLIKVQKPKK